MTTFDNHQLCLSVKFQLFFAYLRKSWNFASCIYFKSTFSDYIILEDPSRGFPEPVELDQTVPLIPHMSDIVRQKSNFGGLGVSFWRGPWRPDEVKMAKTNTGFIRGFRYDRYCFVWKKWVFRRSSEGSSAIGWLFTGLIRQFHWHSTCQISLCLKNIGFERSLGPFKRVLGDRMRSKWR